MEDKELKSFHNDQQTTSDPHFSLFLRKVFIKALGYSKDALSRPVIGVVSTYSSFNPCHANVPQLIEAVKQGVQLRGGLAIDFPAISIHESFSSRTCMFLRNLMSMDTEEMIKAQPVMLLFLLELMGAISANKPVAHLVTGPMMPGSHRGVRIGACTDCRSDWASYRAGTLDIEDISAINDEVAPTPNMWCNGDCKRISAGCTSRLRIAEETGRIAVELATDKVLKPQALLTRSLLLNAITVLQAIGGSTNAVVQRGNLAPRGAVIKASASKYRRLLKHSGRAIVFKNSEDMARKFDDPSFPSLPIAF
ncbi:putative Dehydratase IlvD1 [Seiridium cardinale]|uniref:Dehydratase IlvD1 n=1 Tax=Seiridium cardinale TaxID=138064 RepID=A0ABR2XIF8_9PEZI